MSPQYIKEGWRYYVICEHPNLQPTPENLENKAAGKSEREAIENFLHHWAREIIAAFIISIANSLKMLGGRQRTLTMQSVIWYIKFVAAFVRHARFDQYSRIRAFILGAKLAQNKF